jgi:hypothetical protein
MKRIRPVFWKRFGRGLRSGKGAPRPRRPPVLGHDRGQPGARLGASGAGARFAHLPRPFPQSHHRHLLGLLLPALDRRL